METGCISLNKKIIVIVKKCEEIFVMFYKVGSADNFPKKEDIIKKILDTHEEMGTIFSNLECDHKDQLLNSILELFLKERKKNFFKFEKDNLHKDFVRSKNTKIITFMHQ